MSKQVQLWVDPSFRKKLKQIAAENEESILETSRRLGGDVNNFENIIKKKNGKRFDFSM